MNALTVAQALAQARASGVDRLDAQLLLARAMERPRSWLLAHDDAPLAAAQAALYRAELTRRAAGEPLAYIVGEKEFHGLALQVNADVLVPRPDTETLVDWALELLRGPLVNLLSPRVVDLGTGSGAIALALKQTCPSIEMRAVDASAAALALARRNAERLGLAIRFAHGSWWQATAGLRFDLAVANPPYIAAADAHLEALRHEPAQALTPGPSGLEALQAIVEPARQHLADGAWLLLEHGFDQAEAVASLLAAQGFGAITTRHDLAGHARCTGARL
jgi:release factor glutamine methyltransferase